MLANLLKPNTFSKKITAKLIRLAVYIHFNLNNPTLLLQMTLSPYRIVIRPHQISRGDVRGTGLQYQMDLIKRGKSRELHIDKKNSLPRPSKARRLQLIDGGKHRPPSERIEWSPARYYLDVTFHMQS